MTPHGALVVGGLLAAGVVLAACSGSGTDRPAPLPARVADGAETVCGVMAESIVLVTGAELGPVEGDLSAENGVGTRACTVHHSEDDGGGDLFVVRVFPADSDEGRLERRSVDGEVGEPPTARLDGFDGAMWGADTPREHPAQAFATVFLGDTVARVFVSSVEPRRSGQDDLEALVRQLVDSGSVPDGVDVAAG